MVILELAGLLGMTESDLPDEGEALLPYPPALGISLRVEAALP